MKVVVTSETRCWAASLLFKQLGKEISDASYTEITTNEIRDRLNLIDQIMNWNQ